MVADIAGTAEGALGSIWATTCVILGTRTAGVRTATAGMQFCKNPFNDTCGKLPLDTRANNIERAPCPKVSEGTALYKALASGTPGIEAISSTGLAAEAAGPLRCREK